MTVHCEYVNIYSSPAGYSRLAHCWTCLLAQEPVKGERERGVDASRQCGRQQDRVHLSLCVFPLWCVAGNRTDWHCFAYTCLHWAIFVWHSLSVCVCLHFSSHFFQHSESIAREYISTAAAGQWQLLLSPLLLFGCVISSSIAC